MPHRDDWERARGRGWDRDWEREDAEDERSAGRYRSLTHEERRDRSSFPEPYARREVYGRDRGGGGWEPREDRFGDYDVGERPGGMVERNWDWYAREPSGSLTGRRSRLAVDEGFGGYGPATAREGWSARRAIRHRLSPGSYYGPSYPARVEYPGEWRRGPHSGRGPKGWRRSDQRILDEVNEALARHSDLDASTIEVTVLHAEVTLTGVVEDRGDKRLAEDIAEDVYGVDDVHNQLKIRRGAFASLTGEKADSADEREARRSATAASRAGAKTTARP